MVETEEKIQYASTENQKILAQYRHKTRKTSSEFNETRKYWLSIATRSEKPAQNTMRPENTGSVSQLTGKSGSVSHRTRNILA
jgi:hypothetical protein